MDDSFLSPVSRVDDNSDRVIRRVVTLEIFRYFVDIQMHGEENRAGSRLRQGIDVKAVAEC
ncbi:MAG: hypothetical protein RBR25_12190 [Trichloromonas sp.]|nr:hypothetical protein [Trichloromonas sp.]